MPKQSQNNSVNPIIDHEAIGKILAQYVFQDRMQNQVPILDEAGNYTGESYDKRLQSQPEGQPNQERLMVHLQYMTQKYGKQMLPQKGQPIAGGFDPVDYYQSEGFGDSVVNVAKQSVNDSLIGLGAKAIQRIFGDSTPDDIFDTTHWIPSEIEQFSAGVGSLLVDTATGGFTVGGAVGSALGSGVIKQGGKMMAKYALEQAIKEVGKDASKYVIGRAFGRILASAPQTVGAFAGHTAMSGALRGVADPKNFDLAEYAKDIGKSAVSGLAVAGVGGALGGSPARRLVSAKRAEKYAEGMKEVDKTIRNQQGKVVAVTKELKKSAEERFFDTSIRTGAEVAVFTGIDPAMEGRLPNKQDLAHSLGMVLGLKLGHLPFEGLKKAWYKVSGKKLEDDSLIKVVNELKEEYPDLKEWKDIPAEEAKKAHDLLNKVQQGIPETKPKKKKSKKKDVVEGYRGLKDHDKGIDVSEADSYKFFNHQSQQIKYKKTNKMISKSEQDGSKESGVYAELAQKQNKLNKGKYNEQDVVGISIAKNTKDAKYELEQMKYELDKAITANATIVTDNVTDRNNPYNAGERLVAKYLRENNYVERDGSGVWRYDANREVFINNKKEYQFTKSSTIQYDLSRQKNDKDTPDSKGYRAVMNTVKKYADKIPAISKLMDRIENAYIQSLTKKGLIDRKAFILDKETGRYKYQQVELSEGYHYNPETNKWYAVIPKGHKVTEHELITRAGGKEIIDTDYEKNMSKSGEFKKVSVESFKSDKELFEALRDGKPVEISPKKALEIAVKLTKKNFSDLEKSEKNAKISQYKDFLLEKSEQNINKAFGKQYEQYQIVPLKNPPPAPKGFWEQAQNEIQMSTILRSEIAKYKEIVKEEGLTEKLYNEYLNKNAVSDRLISMLENTLKAIEQHGENGFLLEVASPTFKNIVKESDAKEITSLEKQLLSIMNDSNRDIIIKNVGYGRALTSEPSVETIRETENALITPELFVEYYKALLRNQIIANHQGPNGQSMMWEVAGQVFIVEKPKIRIIKSTPDFNLVNFSGVLPHEGGKKVNSRGQKFSVTFKVKNGKVEKLGSDGSFNVREYINFLKDTVRRFKREEPAERLKHEKQIKKAEQNFVENSTIVASPANLEKNFSPEVTEYIRKMIPNTEVEKDIKRIIFFSQDMMRGDKKQKKLSDLSEDDYQRQKIYGEDKIGFILFESKHKGKSVLQILDAHIPSSYADSPLNLKSVYSEIMEHMFTRINNIALGSEMVQTGADQVKMNAYFAKRMLNSDFYNHALYQGYISRDKKFSRLNVVGKINELGQMEDIKFDLNLENTTAGRIDYAETLLSQIYEGDKFIQQTRDRFYERYKDEIELLKGKKLDDGWIQRVPESVREKYYKFLIAETAKAQTWLKHKIYDYKTESEFDYVADKFKEAHARRLGYSVKTIPEGDIIKPNADETFGYQAPPIIKGAYNKLAPFLRKIVTTNKNGQEKIISPISLSLDFMNKMKIALTPYFKNRENKNNEFGAEYRGFDSLVGGSLDTIAFNPKTFGGFAYTAHEVFHHIYSKMGNKFNISKHDKELNQVYKDPQILESIQNIAKKYVQERMKKEGAKDDPTYQKYLKEYTDMLIDRMHHERFAMFGEIFITRPDIAKKLMPEFYKHFIFTMKKNQPKEWQHILEYREGYVEWQKKIHTDVVQGIFEKVWYEAKEPKNILDKTVYNFHRTYQKLFDRTYGLQHMIKAYELVTGSVLPPKDNIRVYIKALANGERVLLDASLHGKPFLLKADLSTENRNIKNMAQVFDGLTQREKIELVMLRVIRTAELYNKKVKKVQDPKTKEWEVVADPVYVGIEKQEIELFNEWWNKQTAEKKKLLTERSDDLSKILDLAVEQLKEAGVISEKTYDNITTYNPFYITMMRELYPSVAESFTEGEYRYPGGTKADYGKGGVKNVAEHTGEFRTDPLQATINMISSAHTASVRHMTMRKFMDFLSVGGKNTYNPKLGEEFGIGHWMQPIDGAELEKEMKVELGLDMNVLNRVFGEKGMKIEAPNGVEVSKDDFVTLFALAKDIKPNEPNLMPLRMAIAKKDGSTEYVLRWFKVKGEIMDAFMNYTNFGQHKWIETALKVANFPVKIIRTITVTLNPAFMLKNIPRDILTAMIQSQNDLSLKEILKAYKDSFRIFFKESGITETEREFLNAGIVESNFSAFDARAKRGEESKKLIIENAQKDSIRIFQALHNQANFLYTNLKKFGTATEAAPRLAEFKKGVNVNKKDFVTARAEARDITVDFLRMGQLGYILNQIIPFFNPALQGVDKMYRTFDVARKDKKLTKLLLYRAGANILLPTLALWMWNKDEEWYQDLSPQEKSIWWHFKIGDQIFRLPKPFDWGMLMGGIPESYLNFAYTKNPDEFKGVTSSMNRLLPFDVTKPYEVIGEVAVLKPFIQYMTNYDLYWDSQIVDYFTARKPEQLQFYNNTPNVWKLFGEIGFSPLKVKKFASDFSAGATDKMAEGIEAVINPFLQDKKHNKVYHKTEELDPTRMVGGWIPFWKILPPISIINKRKEFKRTDALQKLKALKEAELIDKFEFQQRKKELNERYKKRREKHE